MEAGGQREEKQSEDGYEVMKIIGPHSNKEAGSPASGGTVNLILNLSNHGDSLVQVLDLPAEAGESLEESTEPIHRVRNSLSASHQNVTTHRCATAPHDLHPLLHTSPCPLSFTFPPTNPHPFFFLPQHAVPQSPAYKNFWRRCQGLLENTLGSLMRKKKLYRQSASEVKGCRVKKNGNACCIFSVCPEPHVVCY